VLQKRCLSVFLQAIKSKHSIEPYTYHLNQFLKWNELEDYDDLLKADEKGIQRNLEDYLIYLKDIFSPNYIPNMIYPIELFYTMNDKNLNTKKLHKMFPAKTKRGGYGHYTREHISSMLENTNKRRTRALILFLSSSGCRVGVIPELKLGNITDYENCKRVVCYTDDTEEYVTFMTPEASKAFDDYLEERQQDRERLDSDSPAFRKNYSLGSAPAEFVTVDIVRSSISLSCKDIKRTKTGTRYNIPTLHGLRKYFNIALKSRHDCNLTLCEKMFGHSTTIPLDNNYAPFSDEKLFEEYKRAIPELTISKEVKLNEELERNRADNESKQKQIDKLESEKDVQLRDMQSQIDSVKELLKMKDELKKS